MEGFKPRIEETKAYTREEAYELATPEHIRALGERLSAIERTDTLYDSLDELDSALKEFSFEIQLDNGNKVVGIPTTLHESQVSPAVYEEWGRSAMEGKVQVTTVKHLVQTIGRHLNTSSGGPFNTDDLLSGVVVVPVVAETIKRLFDNRDN